MKGLAPEQLRIELSRPLGAIRSARATEAASGLQHVMRAVSLSPVEELTRLADLLEKGLLTSEEFDLITGELVGRLTSDP